MRLVLATNGKNRGAIGARVTCAMGGRKRVDEVSGGDGYLSVNDRTITLGLGAAAKMDAVGRALAGRHDGEREGPRARALQVDRGRRAGAREALTAGAASRRANRGRDHVRPPHRLRTPRSPHPHVLEVELVLEAVEDVVADDLLVAQLQEAVAAAPRSPYGGARATARAARAAGPSPSRPLSARTRWTYSCRTPWTWCACRLRSSIAPSRCSRAASASARRALALLRLAGAVLLHAQPPHERREREPLDDERPEDDRERDEDDEAPGGKRRPVGQHERQRQRRRERDDAAHPRPSHDDDRLPGRIRVALAVLREEIAREIGAREHPDEPHDDHRPERREDPVHDRRPGPVESPRAPTGAAGR